MKTLVALSVVAVMALTSGAQAGGLFTKKTNILSNITGIAAGVNTGDINVLNGNTVAIGNNSNILSGIGNGGILNGVLNGNGNGNGVLNGVLNGNGLLGLGGQNKHRGW